MKPSPTLSPYGKAVFRIVTAATATTMALAILGITHPKDVTLVVCCFWSLFWLMLEAAWLWYNVTPDDDDPASRW
ncbi:MAG TPA: hypothetical protein VF534_01470 [Paraburkholderia sp.]